MKKSKLTKLLAVILALSIAMASFCAVTASASSAYPIISNKVENPAMVVIADIMDTLVRFVSKFFSGLLDDGPSFVPDATPETNKKIAANFYEGLGKNFTTAAAANAKWNIGYANTSLIPNNYNNGTYYIGGYLSIKNGFSNAVEGIVEIPGIGKDDMKVRSIAINDGTGKGTILFATVDCIGLTNADIKDIRALLADFAAANNIVAINIASTHAHSCIDTEGLWTRTMSKPSLNTDKELAKGANPAYMDFLKQNVANSLKAAFADLKPGTLTYAKKDIGQAYFKNKNRPSAGEVIDEKEGKTQIAMTDLNRFVFTPDDRTKKPTMMLNMAAHPDVAGLPTDTNTGKNISGDYIFYCGKFLEQKGYNFMFWQGAIAGIYMNCDATNDNITLKQSVEQSQRYGYEIARMALSLTKTVAEIEADPDLSNKAEIDAHKNDKAYTVWYKDWAPVSESPVDPFLNLYIKQVEVPVSNDIIESIGKLNLANYMIIAKPDGSYTTVLEIGYMEIGGQFKAVFIPGEICQDLIAPNGKSLSAKYSATAQDFKAPTASSIFGNDIQCFGLMNDSIGYVVPDNDYTMGNPVSHQQEIVSLGQHVASSLMEALAALSSEIVYA